jgi:hypothetical protein
MLLRSECQQDFQRPGGMVGWALVALLSACANRLVLVFV